MRRRSWLALLLALVLSGLVVSATALGGPAAPSALAVVKTAFNKKLKKTIVVDGAGRTLYMFTVDIGRTSYCTASVDPECPKIWPPFTSTGAPRAGKGIKASLLSTAKRPDGRRQVMYNGHLLYHFAGNADHPGDKKPGDANGQSFLHLWYVLSPKGTPIRK